MARYLRSSAFRLALGYIAVSIAVLGLFAAPLWYAWRQNVQEVRAELLREDAQSLADIFRNQGPEVLAAVIDARCKNQQLPNSLILFTDPAQSRLAGNLDAWPPEASLPPGRAVGDTARRTADIRGNRSGGRRRRPGDRHLQRAVASCGD